MHRPLCNPLVISSTQKVFYRYNPSGNNTVFIWKENYADIKIYKKKTDATGQQVKDNPVGG